MRALSWKGCVTVSVVAVAGAGPIGAPTELHCSYVEYDPEFVFGGSVADLQVAQDLAPATTHLATLAT